MAGTRTGGMTARDKMLARDPDYYKKLGKRGGSKKGVVKGFAYMRENGEWDKISKAGRLGGLVSRKGKKLTPEERAEILKEVIDEQI